MLVIYNNHCLSVFTTLSKVTSNYQGRKHPKYFQQNTDVAFKKNKFSPTNVVQAVLGKYVAGSVNISNISMKYTSIHCLSCRKFLSKGKV